VRISRVPHFASVAERVIFKGFDSKPVQTERTMTSLSAFYLEV